MPIKIQIEGEGLTFIKETTLLKAGQIIAFLSTETPLQKSAHDNLDLISAGGNNKSIENIQSPIEFIKKSGAKTNPQKITVFCYFLIKKTGQDSSSSSEIKNLFRRTGTPIPVNFSRDLKDAVASGYIYSENEDEYFLTDTGNNMVENGFTQSKKTFGRKNTSKNNPPANPIRETLENLPFVSEFKDLPSLHELNKSLQLLWILVYCDAHQISNLTLKEVEFVGTKFKLGITTRNVTALVQSSIKNQYIQRSANQELMVLQKGIDYLKTLKNEEVSKGRGVI